MSETKVVEAAKTEVEEAKTEEKPEVLLNDFILTKSAVTIVNPSLAGDKITAIMCEAINRRMKSGIMSLVFRTDGWPKDIVKGELKPVFAMTYADTYSVAINLKHCWEAACDEAARDEHNLSLLGLLWVNVLSTIGHELDHLAQANIDREEYEAFRLDKQTNDELERLANIAAEAMIIKLAKEVDIEIPAAGEMGYFGACLMELFTSEDTKDLAWVIKARRMMEDGIIYKEDEKEIKSFRQFVKEAYEHDEEGWDQPVAPCTLEAHLEDGSIEHASAEPVPMPVVNTVEQPEAAEVPEQQLAANALFVGAGAEMPETQSVVDAPQDIPETVSAEAPLAAAVAAPAELEVPLPAPVAAQQATYATAAQTATPPPAYSETPLPPCNLAKETMPAVLEQIWRTLYHHVFVKCGWQQNPQTGRFYFSSPAAVLEGVNIQHILQQYGAEGFIIEYKTLNAQGQVATEPCTGMIRGYQTSNIGLPAYTLWLNIDGHRIERRFVPQNPDKIGANNAYSRTAVEAQGGHMIAYVYRAEASQSAEFTERCAVKIHDNQYEAF